MDNVVESIFGLSPAQIQQRQNVGMMTAANNYANQDPLQRAAASMFAGGGMLAGAGAQAAGMMTPDMQQAQMREQALHGLDTSSSQAIFERAAQIQDPRLKIGLIEMGKRAQAIEIEARKQALSERKQDFQEQDAMDFKREKLAQDFKLATQRAEDQRASAEERASAMREANQIKLQIAQLMAETRRMQAGAKGPALTKGQEAVDRAFGKEYADYQAGGGSADVEKQLKQLDQVANELSQPGNDYTGPMVGLIPEKARAFSNQAAVDAKNKVEEVAQRNLRLVLGAQFTQVEGERLIARAYNPSLDPSVNAARVKALADQIRTAAKAKEDAARYFEENGTLAGWKGRVPTLSDFESAIESVTPKQSASGKIQNWSIKRKP